MTTNYVFLGSGTTDSNGVAKLDHDANGDPISHSYTGSGVGEVDVVASLDDPDSISDSSLQSETYSLMDCIKYDKGNTANTIWTLGNNSNAQLDLVDNSYRKLSEITLGTDAWVYLKIDHQCALEFDVKLTSTNYGAKFFQFGQTTNAGTRGEDSLLQPLQNGDWHHIKLTFDNGVASMSSPETTTTKSINITNYDASVDMYFRFRTLSDVTEISFKEFKYYPI